MNSDAGSLNQFNEDITAGPDSNNSDIWYTQQSFAAIVQLSLEIPPPPTGTMTTLGISSSSPVYYGQTVTLTGYRPPHIGKCHANRFGNVLRWT